MKLKSKTKRLLGTFALATTFVAAAAGGLMSISNDTEMPVASATEGLEVTHLTGMRSNTPRIYWRLDGTAYTDYKVIAENVACKYVPSEGDESSVNVNIKYNASTGSKGPGTTSSHDGATKYACLYFESSATNKAAVGDKITIPSGTVLKDTDLTTDKYYFDQDYVFVCIGINTENDARQWAFDESSEKIRVGLTGTGYKTKSATIFEAYCDEFLGDYYTAEMLLNASASAELITEEGTSTTSVKLTYTATEAGSVSKAQPAIKVELGAAVTEGDKIVLKEGTTVFDNFTFDRDYTFTYIGTSDYGDAYSWSMSAATDETDPEVTLSLRGTGASGYINLYMTQPHDKIANLRFAMNPAITVNGETKYVHRMHALSGTNPWSFGIQLTEGGKGYVAKENDLVVLEKGTYILGYRLADTTVFKFDGSGWSIIACDGKNHILDEYTCHDRVCVCGEVVKATTEHIFADGTFVCQERACTTCGDTVAAEAHTIPNGSYECSGYTCSVCSTAIAADESKHVKEGEGCDVKCANCKKEFSSHEYPEMPAEGWVKGNTLLTVTEEPTCTETGKGTIACVNCSASTTEVVVNALGHSVPDGEKYCEREGCNYRIPYTADDMAEILALQDLTKYTYSDAHAIDEQSVLGSINRTPDLDDDGAETSVQSNDFIINSNKVGDKQYEYVTGKESTHNMLVSFSINLSAYAQNNRSSYVWLNAHENGSWGIGFMFCFYENAQNLRVQYKSTDGKEVNVVAAKTLTGFALNKEQDFQLGVVQNSDGSYFVFAYYNGELLLTGTLSNAQLTQYANADSHNGLGGAVAFRFNGSTSAPAPVGSICDLEHSVEGTQYACKEYACKVCSATIAATEEHSWGNGVSNGNGSCTVKEQFTRTCATCGDTTTYEGDYVHEWDMENPTIVTPAACNGVDRVERYGCKHCEAVSVDTTIPDTGFDGAHDFANNYHDVTPATCIAGGTEQSTCEKCGALSEISDTLPNKNAHSYGTEIAEVSATCTENGTAAHYKCALCDKLFTEENGVYTEVTAEDLVIAATHNYGTEIAEVSATCTENGRAAHYACSACGKLFTKENDVYTEVTGDDLVIAAGHNYVFVAAVAATAEADGMAEHYACSACGKLFTKEGDVYTETTEDALKVEYIAPETPVDDNDDKKDDKDEKGCGSSASVIGVLSLLAVCGGAFAALRKKED